MQASDKPSTQYSDEATLYAERAIAAFQQNDLSQSIQFMQKAALASPLNALYQRNLGELLRRSGQLDAAITAHKNAIAIEPESAENHYHLAIALNDKHYYEEAITHYRIALSHDLNHGLAWNNLGAVLECIGGMPAAKAAYSTAIKINPLHAEAQNNLGVVHSNEGTLDEACICFEAAIAAQPNFPEAHYNLSLLKTYTKDDPHLALLNTMAKNDHQLSENARIHYYFALAKVLDDVGEYKRAFQCYAEGNRLKYAQEPWNSLPLERMIEQIPLVFTPSFLKKPRKAKGSRHPIFIVGMPRSGSTLIEQILSSHGEIYGVGETNILDEVLNKARSEAPHIPFSDWASQLSDDSLMALGESYLERTWALAPDKRIIVDKTLSNCFYIGMIYRMFPECKIIHAVRDPMDSCLSCFTHLFKQSMPFSYDQEALAKYYIAYAEIMQHWHSVLPKGLIVDLPYERMVADHEAETKKLLDYIGVAWDPNCLNFYNNNRLVKTASLAQVRKPIYQSSVKRWEHFSDGLQTLANRLAPYRSLELS